MQFSEAVVRGAFRRPDGTQELELDAVCPAANYDRLNVLVGKARVAVPLDRPARGASCRVTVRVGAEASFSQGDKVAVEFFYPGEQAGVCLGGLTSGGLN